MSGSAAYLRRSLATLEWIDSTWPEAIIIVDGHQAGVWKDLHLRWRVDGDRIRLQLHLAGGGLALWISSVQPDTLGVRMLIHGRQPAREIRVTWAGTVKSGEAGRHELLESAGAWVRQRFPGGLIVSPGQVPDRSHSLSGSYLRLRVKWRAADHLVLACAPGEAEGQVAGILTQALLWLSCLVTGGGLNGVPTVHLLIPRGDSSVLVHRSNLVNPALVRIEILEYTEGAARQWETRTPDPPAQPCENRDFRWPVLGPFRWSPLMARVLALAPEHIQRYPRFDGHDSLRLYGLEFARVLGVERDRICFGTGSHQMELTEDTFEDLRALVDEIIYYRRPDSPASEHPYYRRQSERWLECLLLSDVARLFPELVPGAVYPQIPVYLGKVPGRVDIIGVDRESNLVVMELKAGEDIEMPMQSLDYWGRVIGHNLSGDFERRGYFAGLRLSRAAPKIYLVSPIFSFHDSTERVLRWLDPKLEVSKIGINEDWRCGVKILRRIRGRCGKLK